MKQIAAIILAAGSSRRFGKSNKLLAKLVDRPVLDHVLSAVGTLPLCDIKAVLSEQSDEICDLCNKHGIGWIVNSQAHLGMGASISAGATAIDGVADGLMITLGDMPFIKEETHHALLTAFSNAPTGSIIAPTIDGARGHPVIFSACYLPDLKNLNGDRGALKIINANSRLAIDVPVDDPGILQDIDHPGDLE